MPPAGFEHATRKGKSATVNADPTKSYSVNAHVTTPTNGVAAGTIIACGDLKAGRVNDTEEVIAA